MTRIYRVGLIGVGLMGRGIAENILRAGHTLYFLDHPGNQPVDDLVKAGALKRHRASEVAAAAEVVILCVTGTPQVEEVLSGDEGVLAGLRPGSSVIDCSTAIPSSTAAVADKVVEAGGRFMDAAMTRTPREAAEGRLNLIVGGDRAMLDEMEPLLRCFAENITHAGAVGAGHTVKLLHNYVSLGFSAVLAEAAAAAGRAGIGSDVFLAVLDSGGGKGAILERLRPFILSGDTSGFRFSLANSLKDIGYYNEMARDVGASRHVATAVNELLSEVNRRGHGESLVPELISLLDTNEPSDRG